MAKSSKNALVLLKMAIKPIARMLIRNNIDCRQFIEAAKQAFVEAATEDYGIRERPTNISRTAIICGLTRKEVARIRRLGSENAQAEAFPVGIIDKIVNGWLGDQDFLTKAKKPKSLTFDSGEISFWELVRRYGGDMPPGAVRTELKRLGMVIVTSSDKLRLTVETKTRRHAPLRKALRLVQHSTTAIDEFEKHSAAWPLVIIEPIVVKEEDVSAIRRTVEKEFQKAAAKLGDVFRAYKTIGAAERDADQSSTKIGLLFTHAEMT